MDFIKFEIFSMIGLIITALIGAVLWLIGFLTKKDTIATIGEWVAIVSAIIIVLINIFG